MMMQMDFGEERDDQSSLFVSCIQTLKKVTTFFLSHVGLISLIVGYCVIGAFTFEALEHRHELEMKQNMTKRREAVTNNLWLMANQMKVLKDDDWLGNTSHHLLVFERDILTAMKKGGWDGNEKNETLQWTFSGALFYSIVVITTIGYGHIAPKTDWGKVVTILYALLGIPLMLLTLSHIGDFLAKAFRFLYWRVCCYVCTRRAPPSRRQTVMRRGRSVKMRQSRPQSVYRSRRPRTRSPTRFSQRSAELGTMSLAEPGNLRRAHSDEDFRTSAQPGRFLRKPPPFRRSYASNRDHHHHHQHHAPAMIDQGLPQRAGSTQLPVLCNIYAEDAILCDDDIQFETRRSRLAAHSEHSLAGPHWYDEEEPPFVQGFEKRPVPIWLCVCLVCTYIIFGAFLFSGWEGWALLDAAYFCFITLTTIGFGDFVPAQRRNETLRGDEIPEVSIALCSLYLLFGISLLAMSFNLVQEEVIHSVKQVAMRIGIIQEEE